MRKGDLYHLHPERRREETTTEAKTPWSTWECRQLRAAPQPPADPRPRPRRYRPAPHQPCGGNRLQNVGRAHSWPTMEATGSIVTSLGVGDIGSSCRTMLPLSAIACPHSDGVGQLYFDLGIEHRCGLGVDLQMCTGKLRSASVMKQIDCTTLAPQPHRIRISAISAPSSAESSPSPSSLGPAADAAARFFSGRLSRGGTS